MIVWVCTAFVFVLGVAGCCGKADEPCASWPQDMTYTVELVEPSETWPNGSSVGVSCGTFLHRDRVSVLPAQLTRKSGGDEGCECIPRHADFMVDGVTELEPERKPHSGPDLIYSARVRLDGGCEGRLEITLQQSYAPTEAEPMCGFRAT